MKNKHWIIVFIVFIISAVGLYIFFNNRNSENNSELDYVAKKTESESGNKENRKNSKSSDGTSKEDKTSQNKENNDNSTNPPIETEIASFTTQILTKDSGRQKNISITCSTLNDTLVENGSTFSFCNTVGQATTDKGYEKAEIFDSKRK